MSTKSRGIRAKRRGPPNVPDDEDYPGIYAPTPEQIAQAAAAISSGWDEATTRLRAGEREYQPYMPPVIDDFLIRRIDHTRAGKE